MRVTILFHKKSNYWHHDHPARHFSINATEPYYVSCQETNNDKKLNWHILTSEPVTCKEDAHRILDYYEKRWFIEEFHKAWVAGHRSKCCGSG
uniref:hypothetical protein n=1 Tax=Xenorhabdus sp. KJ12.1 TaxID=1851571 RepID=UPI000C04FB9F|nr:hypothetical protein [Xenorhabdus sp. KJ12.1]